MKGHFKVETGILYEIGLCKTLSIEIQNNNVQMFFLLFPKLPFCYYMKWWNVLGFYASCSTNFMPYYSLYSRDLNIFVLTTFCWDALFLCSMTHDITMAHNVARDAHYGITMNNDIHCDITMGNDVAMCTSQCITMLLWTSFVMYYYAKLW